MGLGQSWGGRVHGGAAAPPPSPSLPRLHLRLPPEPVCRLVGEISPFPGIEGVSNWRRAGQGEPRVRARRSPLGRWQASVLPLSAPPLDLAPPRPSRLPPPALCPGALRVLGKGSVTKSRPNGGNSGVSAGSPSGGGFPGRGRAETSLLSRGDASPLRLGLLSSRAKAAPMPGEPSGHTHTHTLTWAHACPYRGHADALPSPVPFPLLPGPACQPRPVPAAWEQLVSDMRLPPFDGRPHV